MSLLYLHILIHNQLMLPNNKISFDFQNRVNPTMPSITLNLYFLEMITIPSRFNTGISINTFKTGRTLILYFLLIDNYYEILIKGNSLFYPIFFLIQLLIYLSQYVLFYSFIHTIYSII